jgi:hypothetical protein
MRMLLLVFLLVGCRQDRIQEVRAEDGKPGPAGAAGSPGKSPPSEPGPIGPAGPRGEPGKDGLPGSGGGSLPGPAGKDGVGCAIADMTITCGETQTTIPKPADGASSTVPGPRGEKGDKGDRGEPGLPGDAGDIVICYYDRAADTISTRTIKLAVFMATIFNRNPHQCYRPGQCGSSLYCLEVGNERMVVP